MKLDIFKELERITGQNSNDLAMSMAPHLMEIYQQQEAMIQRSETRGIAWPNYLCIHHKNLHGSFNNLPTNLKPALVSILCCSHLQLYQAIIG